jgi:hypothetical protein
MTHESPARDAVALLPCPNPWCEEPSRTWAHNYSKPLDWAVVCACGFMGPLRITKEEAIRAWNTRLTTAPQGIPANTSAASARGEADGWRSIETAPKDGASILAVVSGTHVATGLPFTPEVVWWESGGWWGAMWHDDLPGGWEPTHWMPLPAAPTPAVE